MSQDPNDSSAVRRRLLKASALSLATAGAYGAAPFFGPWKHNHAWAQAGQKKPLVIGLTMDASGQYAASGGLLDMTLESIRDWGSDAWLPGLAQPGNVDGMQYGIPWYAANRVVIYNKDLFAAAGITKPPKDRAEWLSGYGAIAGYPDLVIERLSDYHGVVTVPPGAARPGLGQIVAVIPNHVCPVIDLVDSVLAVDADGRMQEWRVDARGRSG